MPSKFVMSMLLEDGKSLCIMDRCANGLRMNSHPAGRAGLISIDLKLKKFFGLRPIDDKLNILTLYDDKSVLK